MRPSKTKLIIMVLSTLVFAAGIALGGNARDHRSNRQKSDQFGHTAAYIRGHRKWTLVNPIPVIMGSRIAQLCAGPTPALQTLEDGNPHRDRFVSVYVNPVGRHAMMREKRPRFPVGTVIVKEKVASKSATSPELLTVMRKREKGYYREGGDWEYAVLDGAGERVLEHGRLQRCVGCHVMEKETGFVSRNYLPEKFVRKLK
jgi:hypothetical protein